MEISVASCCTMPTNATKRWLPYVQYYQGEEDDKRRRSGLSENHWSGAESLESYTGKFTQDTMHGEGEYRWRYKGSEGCFVSYEGWFYGNRLHGHGVMSYPDGRVYSGLFYNNVRWGPGIESHAHLQEDVGLWRGNQLVRLAWRPQTPSVTLDLNISPNAKAWVKPHRTLLTTRVQTVGEVNNALELLKQSGATPTTASQKWPKLYPKNCTDLASQACHIAMFDQEYYKTKIFSLEEVDSMPEPQEDSSLKTHDDFPECGTYYAWNNSAMMISMMKHCFKHEEQRSRSGIDLENILSGLRTHYNRGAKHELDCRTLLMASYLGQITLVAQLINEDNVHPDVADILGNTALMYATCGDQGDIVHFLVEAGANVNSYNDSCCTPLGVALMKFACANKNIAASGMVQALVPASSIPSSSLEDTPSEWHILRDLTVQSPNGTHLTRTGSKTNKSIGLKKSKLASQEVITGAKKKNSAFSALKIISANKVDEGINDDILSDKKRISFNINTEYSIRVTDLFSEPKNGDVYIFDFIDMAKYIDSVEEESKKPSIMKPSKSVTKVIKNMTQPSHDITLQGSEKDQSVSSADQMKSEMLTRNMSTIVQLLKDGADPRLVRCPQPALRIATASGSPDLIRLLVKYGADINEVYPDALNYTALDVAVSQPLTYENLELIRALLECGASTDHRLEYRPGLQTEECGLGPTLLHAVIAQKIEKMTTEEEIRLQLLELLLEYNCNALTQFKGHSALDMVMTNKGLLEIFAKCPKIDLNAVINSRNQTVLVKIFSLQFFQANPVAECLQILTELLLYGADPLLECQDEDEKYQNIFVFARNNLVRLASYEAIQSTVTAKQDTKAKKSREKIKKEHSSKSLGKNVANDIFGDYKLALDLVTECARMLHVRWIQAKLLKELIGIVEKYEHRQWNMILPEYKSKKACGLWLSYSRALEIWDIIKATRKKKVTDRRVLKHVLCIVHFNCNRSKTTFKRPVTAEEKSLIDNDVVRFLSEYMPSKESTEQHWTRPYVTPELFVGDEKKFQVCFECIIPLEENKIQCTFCKQVSFCSLECIKMNIERAGTDGHPCSEDLKSKYFQTPSESDSQMSNPLFTPK